MGSTAMGKLEDFPLSMKFLGLDPKQEFRFEPVQRRIKAGTFIRLDIELNTKQRTKLLLFCNPDYADDLVTYNPLTDSVEELYWDSSGLSPPGFLDLTMLEALLSED